MSTSPVIPDFKQQLKTFWQRPEGKTGMLVLAGVGLILAGGVLVNLASIMAWAAGIMENTFLLLVYSIGTVALLCIVTSKSFRSAVSNIFQLIMRKITGLVIELDPIGILQNTLDGMKDNRAKLDKAVGGCNGAKLAVEHQMQANKDAIAHATSIKEEADHRLSLRIDDVTKQRYALQRQAQLQEIGRRMHSNEKLDVIDKQTTKMVDLLNRWRNLADFNIQNTEGEIDNARSERNAIMKAYEGMGFAKRIISGDPEQLKRWNQSLEFLAEDNSKKLGEMEDFANYSEKFLTEMDLQQGAAADDAEKMLAQYENKLLGAGSPPVIDAVPVSSSNSTLSSDYLEIK